MTAPTFKNQYLMLGVRSTRAGVEYMQHAEALPSELRVAIVAIAAKREWTPMSQLFTQLREVDVPQDADVIYGVCRALETLGFLKVARDITMDTQVMFIANGIRVRTTFGSLMANDEVSKLSESIVHSLRWNMVAEFGACRVEIAQ